LVGIRRRSTEYELIIISKIDRSIGSKDSSVGIEILSADRLSLFDLYSQFRMGYVVRVNRGMMKRAMSTDLNAELERRRLPRRSNCGAFCPETRQGAQMPRWWTESSRSFRFQPPRPVANEGSPARSESWDIHASIAIATSFERDFGGKEDQMNRTIVPSTS
jgi:hypothetical protein